MSPLLPLVSSGVIISKLDFILPLQIALQAFDILLTFPYEVKHIWQKKIKLGAILYLMAQYPPVVIFSGQFIQFPTTKVRHVVLVMYRTHTCVQ